MLKPWEDASLWVGWVPSSSGLCGQGRNAVRDSGRLKVLSWESCLGSRSPGPVCQVPIFVSHQLSIPENKWCCCELIGNTGHWSVEGVLCGVPVWVAGFQLCCDHGQLHRSGGSLQPELLYPVHATGNSPWYCLGTYLPTILLQTQGRASQPLLLERTFRLCNVWLQLCLQRAVHSSCGLSLQQAVGVHQALEKSPWASSSSWPSPARVAG